jgi:hypothetical protein
MGTSSGHVVWNDLQWFILVTFKCNISNNEVHELGDSRQTLSLYCGRYIRITSVSKQKGMVTTDGFSKCLHRQTSDQVLQTPR